MKAMFGKIVVAAADFDEVVGMEGNVYFPPQTVTADALRNSPTAYTCPWKGSAQYHDLLVGEAVLEDAAWSYPSPTEYALAHVGRDFSGYIAFDTGQVRIER
jgi:uncharacterized protein (DUF427 family)